MMEQAITEILRQSPVAIVLFWMVSVFNKKDDAHRQEIRELHTKMINVIENNTDVVSKVNSSVIENTKATETLSSRIYDVLVDKNGRNTI